MAISHQTAYLPKLAFLLQPTGFFDFYVIPLAKKLKDCSVFGVSSDEYLNYAEQNRTEWEAKGQQQVAMYLEKYGDNNEHGGLASTTKTNNIMHKIRSKGESPTPEGSTSSGSCITASPSITSNADLGPLQQIESSSPLLPRHSNSKEPQPFFWRGMLVCEC